MAKKRIGILTSGGDCAGLNAAIRAVVHRADLLGWETVGLLNGTAGLMKDPPLYRILTPNDTNVAMMRTGGTILGTTNKGNPFAFPMADGSTKDLSGKIVEGFKALGLMGVIGIGGDGSFAILQKLARQGNINLVGIPKTIDNDIGMTETSIGFDTAVTMATEALDRLQPTAASHDRVMILEVMGRDAGHIALSAGIAGGADIILIPEVKYKLDAIAAKIKQVKDTGRNYALIVVSEAVKTETGEKVVVTWSGGEKRYGGIGQYLSGKISDMTGSETRVSVLGHVQRGAPPTYNDRLIASTFGVKAVDLINEGKFGRMVAWQNRQVIDVAIDDAVKAYSVVDINGTMAQTARALGISLGDQ